jgi:hypothetical protein
MPVSAILKPPPDIRKSALDNPVPFIRKLRLVKIAVRGMHV